MFLQHSLSKKRIIMNKLLDTTQTYFFGRSYSETLRCFGFNQSELEGKMILNCASGPSSFTADANARGISVTAVDPVYYRSSSTLKALGEVDYEKMFRKMRAKPELFRFDYYKSFEEAEADRYGALNRFLNDYRDSYPTGRYVAGSLPELPFDDRAFDVVLCGHLFFVYAFDFQFHLQSLLELCRVSRKEVRIHPIVDSSGCLHEFLDPLMSELERFGYSCQLEKVEHAFFKGSDRTLVIRRET